MPGRVEIHCHVIPAVDDGARNVGESERALEAYASQGVGRLVATPHFDASVTRDPERFEAAMAALDAGWLRLGSVAAHGVELHRGVELRLDIPRPELADPRLRLGGGPAVLVEFFGFSVPPGSATVLADLAGRGYRPVLAHAERYRGFGGDPATAREWLEAGAALQVNTGSLLGEYGAQVERAAWELLGSGLAHVIAGDFHAREGGPGFATAADAILERGGDEEMVELLMSINPGRLLDGEPPLPVRPLRTERRGWAGRLLKRLWPGEERGS